MYWALCLIFICSVNGFSQRKANKVGRPTIVVAAPTAYNDYYEKYYSDIVDFLVDYSTHVVDDNFIILGDMKAYNYLKNESIQLPIDRFLYARIGDIWMRDLTSTGKKQLAMFGYSPDYIPEWYRPIVRESFLVAMEYHGIDRPYVKETDIVVDGGNVVDDGVNSAILTTRIFKDNENYSESEIEETIGKMLDYENIIVVDEYPGDTTGHSDGMVTFVDTNQMGVSRLGFGNDDKDANFADKTYNTLKQRLTSQNITVFKVPNKFDENEVKFDNFTSACGSHVNSLVTDQNLYMPTFGCDTCGNSKMYTKELDQEVHDVIYNHTAKKIVQVPIPHKICRMGGNLRCLSWQVKGEIANSLVEAAQTADYANRDMQAIEDHYPDPEPDKEVSSSSESSGEEKESFSEEISNGSSSYQESEEDY